MKRTSARSILPWIYGGSVAVHAVLAGVTLSLPREQHAEAVAIELADIKKKKDPPKPPAPPPPPPPPPQEKPKPPPPRPAAQAQAKIAPEPAKVEAAPPPLEVGADGFADLGGVAVGGGGGEGIALAAPAAATTAAAGPRAAAKPKATTRKVEELVPAAVEACHEPVVRPKPKSTRKAEYTMKAREAEIEGDVVYEVTVDETGHVISARLVRGLGYGLDESAKTAAMATEFQPATLCGKAVVGTVKLRFTFEGT